MLCEFAGMFWRYRICIFGSESNEPREKKMTDAINNRVLCRRGARKLTALETEIVNGGQIHTDVCSAITQATATQTGPGDGDACGDTDYDH